MAEEDKVATTKVTLKHGGRVGQRVFVGADGTQTSIGPGQEVEVELPEAQAKQLKEAAEAGYGDLIVDGTDPKESDAAKNEAAPEVPPEHGSRAAVAAKEAELMKAGQDADKEAAETRSKKSGAQLAAETGILAHARGVVETVASPPDAPPPQEQPAATSHSASRSSHSSRSRAKSDE